MKKEVKIQKEQFNMDGKTFDVFYAVVSYGEITSKIKLKTNDTEKALLDLVLAEAKQ